MYTYLNKDLQERTLPEGVRLTDGPRRNWVEKPWPNTSVFVRVEPSNGESYFSTLTEASVKQGMTVRALSRLVSTFKDGEDFRIFRIPRSIFIAETGRAGILVWDYFWQY